MSRTLSNLRLLGASAALAAGFAMQPASAQLAVSPDGTGNALVIPYYTVNGGWETLVNITNTTDNSLAVKFRVHEGSNSRDVLDFNIALSPRDVWTATILRDGSGRPRLITNDRSCTSPLSIRDAGQTATEIAYANVPTGTTPFNFSDYTETENLNSPAAINRLADGYIVVLLMGEDDREVGAAIDTEDEIAGTTDLGAPSLTHAAYIDSGNVRTRGSTAYYAKHINGEPRDCEIVDGDFAPTANGGQPMALADLDGVDPILGQNGAGDPLARAGHPLIDPVGGEDATEDNPFGYGEIVSESALKVNATIVNQNRGVSAGVPALNVNNYGVGVNLVTAQEFPWFLEPTLAGTNGLWTTAGLIDLEDDIGALTVANVWTSVTGTGAQGEWVVTFPTKRFRVDRDFITGLETFANVQAACNEYRNSLTADGVPALAGDCVDADENEPFTKFFQTGDTGTSPVNATFGIYDREERVATITNPGGTRPSPAPPGDPVPTSVLDFETNVLRIGRNVAALPGVLNSGRTRLVDVGELGLGGTAQAGWLQLNFRNADNNGPAAVPVSGFLVTQRDFGDPSRNFGNAGEHAYTRP